MSKTNTKTRVCLAFAAAGALTLLQAALLSTTALAQTLSGTVTSAEESNMEGVVVTAKKDGSPINISVVTDNTGKYSFPTGRLEPGHYTLKARAAGFDL